MRDEIKDQRTQNFAAKLFFDNPTTPTANHTQEVQKHRTPSDAWMVYRNKVYDVSNWHEVRVAR